jgi:hypothetical protein
MSVPALHPIADSLPEIRVSTGSIWSDHVWQLDVTLPGTVRSDVALDWVFTLPDGSRFTDAQWTTWRDAAKRFLWTLRVDPPSGRRRARDSSLVRRFQHLRVLIRWMAGEGTAASPISIETRPNASWRRSKPGPAAKAMRFPAQHWPATRAFCTSSICNAIGCRMRRERIS